MSVGKYCDLIVLIVCLCINYSTIAAKPQLPDSHVNTNSSQLSVEAPISFMEIQSRVSNGLNVEDGDLARLGNEKRRMAIEIANYLFKSDHNVNNNNNLRKGSKKPSERRRQVLSSYPETPQVEGQGKCAKKMDDWMSVCIFDDY